MWKNLKDRILTHRKLAYHLSGFLVVFVFGFLIAKYFGAQTQQLLSDTYPIRQNSSYKFIKPLLACAISENKESTEYTSLKNETENIIKDFQNNKKIDSASVYFRNLNIGRWMGINENEKYAPASLYKVTLMIAYLKSAEQNPSLLNKTIIFTGSRSSETPDFAPMVLDKKYTIKDLLERLIIYSDNDAKDILHDNLNQDYVNDVFTDLGLNPPGLQDTGDSMSAKAYSIFFRTLYNATYLNKDMSELALNILSRAQFEYGLVKGIPSNTKIAHKFGYRTFDPPENGITRELHDCGIIYANSNPYFLCVMTKGWNNNDLESVIQTISKKVYEEVAK